MFGTCMHTPPCISPQCASTGWKDPLNSFVPTVENATLRTQTCTRLQDPTDPVLLKEPKIISKESYFLATEPCTACWNETRVTGHTCITRICICGHTPYYIHSFVHICSRGPNVKSAEHVYMFICRFICCVSYVWGTNMCKVCICIRYHTLPVRHTWFM